MPHSQERKLNNRGASLIMVVSVVAIVSILVAVLLSVSFLNYRMKNVNLHSQDNFYDAETVLDEIRTGLTEDISEAVSTAYKATLEQYGSLTEEERNELYLTTFFDTIEGDAVALLDPDEKDPDASYKTDATKTYFYYNLAHLWGMVSDEKKADTELGTNGCVSFSTKDDLSVSGADGTVTFKSSLRTAKYNSAQFHPILVVDKTAGTITLKNFVIKYTDEKNYMTQILTDIVLECPPIDYLEQSANPTDLLSYAFVANTQTDAVGGMINVSGNAYMGYDGTLFNTTTLNIEPIAGATSGKVITGGQLFAQNDTKLSISNMATWVQEMCIDASELTISGTEAKTYLRDDLTMENNSGDFTSAVLAGEVKAYGNPDTSSRNTDADCDAERSSAFLINCKNATIDLSGVTQLMIAGNSYVATASTYADESGTNKDGVVGMGESISLKSDQRSYLVPSEYIAPNCASGGKNPMSESDYNELVKQIAEVGNVSEAAVENNALYFLNESNATLPDELIAMGVVDVVKQVYRVQLQSQKSVSMIYFFLVFNSDQAAVNYGMKVAEDDSSLSTRVDTSHYKTTITYPASIFSTESSNEENAVNSYSFYYNGSVLVPDGTDSRFLTGLCTKLTSGKNSIKTKLRSEQLTYQDKFEALRHKLVDYYSDLTSTEKTQTVYPNLVRDLVGADANYNINPGDFKSFQNIDKDTGNLVAEAIVVNGDCILSGDSTKQQIYAKNDETGALVLMHEFSELHLIIAEGDVTIQAGTDFTGLILSGSDVIFENGPVINLHADIDLASQAMAAKDTAEAAGYDDKYMAADYMINGSVYLPQGTTHALDDETEALRYQDYVSYENWKKY